MDGGVVTIEESRGFGRCSFDVVRVEVLDFFRATEKVFVFDVGVVLGFVDFEIELIVLGKRGDVEMGEVSVGEHGQVVNSLGLELLLLVGRWQRVQIAQIL